jgi:hypothetical protein
MKREQKKKKKKETKDEHSLGAEMVSPNSGGFEGCKFVVCRSTISEIQEEEKKKKKIRRRVVRGRR